MSSTTFEQQYEEALKQFTQAQPQPTVAPSTAPPKSTPTKPQFFFDDQEKVPDTWRPFSAVFGFDPPSGNDRYGPVYEPLDFPEELRAFIPVKNAGYYMPGEETEALWNAHIDKDIVWLWGQSGTGKSSLEEQFAAYIGQPFLRFNGREDVESSALFGMMTVESGEHGGTVWKDGLLTEGVRYGARVLMDEATVIGAGIWMGVQWLLEKDGKLMLVDKPASAGERLVEPDPRFRLTFADNTRGQGDENGNFNGTGIMNTATLNRVGLTMEIKFLPKLEEIEVLARKHGARCDKRLISRIVDLAGLLRRAMRENQISLSFSLRTEDSLLRKAWNYRTMPVMQALNRAYRESYTNLLPTAEEQQAAQNFFTLAFDNFEKGN